MEKKRAKERKGGKEKSKRKKERMENKRAKERKKERKKGWKWPQIIATVGDLGQEGLLDRKWLIARALIFGA